MHWFSLLIDASLLIVVNTKAPHIDGRVVDKSGDPVPDTSVVLIPDEREKADHYKTGTTDSTGHFSIRSIYPGRGFASKVVRKARN